MGHVELIGSRFYFEFEKDRGDPTQFSSITGSLTSNPTIGSVFVEGSIGADQIDPKAAVLERLMVEMSNLVFRQRKGDEIRSDSVSFLVHRAVVIAEGYTGERLPDDKLSSFDLMIRDTSVPLDRSGTQRIPIQEVRLSGKFEYRFGKFDAEKVDAMVRAKARNVSVTNTDDVDFHSQCAKIQSRAVYSVRAVGLAGSFRGGIIDCPSSK